MRRRTMAVILGVLAAAIVITSVEITLYFEGYYLVTPSVVAITGNHSSVSPDNVSSNTAITLACQVYGLRYAVEISQVTVTIIGPITGTYNLTLNSNSPPFLYSYVWTSGGFGSADQLNWTVTTTSVGVLTDTTYIVAR